MLEKRLLWRRFEDYILTLPLTLRRDHLPLLREGVRF